MGGSTLVYASITRGAVRCRCECRPTWLHSRPLACVPSAPDITSCVFVAFVVYVTSSSSHGQFASDASYMSVQCPRCMDGTSGIAAGSLTFDVADVTNFPSSPSARVLGADWTNDAMVLGFPVPLTDNTPYTVTCVCYNNAGLPTTTPSNVIVTDFTVPVCGFAITGPATSASAPLPLSWSCGDDQSGLRAASYWWLGTTVGGQDVTTRSPTTVTTGAFADVASSELSWTGGVTYYYTVEVTNNAGVTAWYTSPGVLVDFTPPVVTAVGSNDAVYAPTATTWYLPGATPLTASWSAIDLESGVATVSVCVDDVSAVAPSVCVSCAVLLVVSARRSDETEAM